MTATATPVIAARLHEGVVVAVRQISIDDAGGSRPGVDAVLAALQAPASTGAIAGQEIVVLQNDGGAVSIIDRHPLAPGFAVGDRVAIAEGGTTALVHGD